MTHSIRELLHETAPRPTSEVALHLIVERGQRHRRHRRVGLIAAGVAVVAVAAGAIFVTSARSDSNQVAVRTPPSTSAPNSQTVTNAAAGLTLSIPANWHVLPVGTSAGPTELLTVGTTKVRPVPGVITACLEPPSPTTASYLSIYEFQPGAPLIDPTGDTFAEAAVIARPHRFETATWIQGDCSSAGGTSTNLDAHFRTLLFTDNGRRFLVRIVTLGDPNDTNATAPMAMLDTLKTELR
jgi:hypothetical protein